MHAVIPGALTLLAAAKKSTSSSSSSYSLIILLVIVGVALYFLFLRPQQQKARKQREANSAVEVGDEIVTVGGIVGRILEMDADRVTIETGDEDGLGTRLVFVRNAIARKAQPPTAEASAPAPAEEHPEFELERPAANGNHSEEPSGVGSEAVGSKAPERTSGEDGPADGELEDEDPALSGHHEVDATDHPVSGEDPELEVEEPTASDPESAGETATDVERASGSGSQRRREAGKTAAGGNRSPNGSSARRRRNRNGTRRSP